MHRLLTAFLAATLGGACSSASTHGVVGKHPGFVDADEWTKVFDDPARNEWQRPDDVLRAMNLAPTMTVADIGAGTGYFAVRLARVVNAGEVIATDVEPDMVRFLNERAQLEHHGNMRAIRAPRTTSGLAAQSVDRILIVHVWHHLADHVAYARDLSAALRSGGKLFVVDFTLTAHRGPPPNMRVAPEAIIADLAAAGLSASLSPLTLPDQYMVEAHRP